MSLDQLPPGSVPGYDAAATATSYPDIDPGGTSLTTLHFTLKGYSEYDLRPVSLLAESLLGRIGNDTGLYAFLASSNFVIVVYKDSDEYVKKTHQPSGSRATMAGSAIYLYPGSDLEPFLAHEMAHLVFDAYVGDRASSLKWLREGLAMRLELAKMSEGDRTSYFALKSAQLRQNRVPFSQMTFFVPNSEEKRRTEVWYQQVESVVAYLLAQGSALGFAQMLNALRSGIDVDRALSEAYPGKFRSLSELETLWKQTI